MTHWANGGAEDGGALAGPKHFSTSFHEHDSRRNMSFALEVAHTARAIL